MCPTTALLRVTALPFRSTLGSVSTHALNHFKVSAIAITHTPHNCGQCAPLTLNDVTGPSEQHTCPCTPPPPAGTQYLVFVDGSPHARRAAQLCTRLARAGDTVHVVVVFERAVPISYPVDGYDPNMALEGPLSTPSALPPPPLPHVLPSRSMCAGRQVFLLPQASRRIYWGGGNFLLPHGGRPMYCRGRKACPLP